MKHKLFSSTMALAMLASSLAFSPGQVQASSTTVVLDGTVAASLLNGVAPTSTHPIIGTNSDHAIGSGSWQAVPGNGGTNQTKFELYVDFSSLGTFTIADIASIAYQTKKGTPQEATDFTLNLYTNACSGSPVVPPDRVWACRVLTAEPYYGNSLNAPANQWNQWTTSSGANQMTFYRNVSTLPLGWAGAAPTLQDMQAGPINWGSYPNSGQTDPTVIDYRAETVKYIVLATGSGWVGFNGLLDNIVISLTNGKQLIIDLEGNPIVNTTVVLDGGYAANLPNGSVSSILYPQHGTTTVQKIGAGAWQSVPGTAGSPSKIELAINPTAAPFASLGAFKISDIDTISYATNNPGSINHDFFVSIYTKPCVGSGWYCSRIQALPSGALNIVAPANTWNTWSTNAGTNQLQLYSKHLGVDNLTLRTLDAIKSDYGTEDVLDIRLTTDSGVTGFDGYLDQIIITLTNGKQLTLDLEDSAVLKFNPSSSALAVGSDLTVNIDLGPITNLMGYQFKVNYDASKVSATGAFVKTWFDFDATSGTPTGFVTWDAVCGSGVCAFAVTKVNSVGGEVNGSGTLATITFHGVTPGVVPLTFSDDILGDRNGYPILHTKTPGVINVYGFATVSGKVYLQGRGLLPHDAGSVILTDASGDFPAVSATYDDASSGNWSATVPVTSTGTTTYKLLATHSVYLSNQKLGVVVTAGGTFAQAATTLKGGDANNSSKVEVNDLTCIGGAFGGPAVLCGTTGSSDINHDGVTNILDLTITGGNYDLESPQSW